MKKRKAKVAAKPVKVRRKRKFLSKAEISDMLKMHKSGEPIAKIVKKHKISTAALYYHINKAPKKKK